MRGETRQEAAETVNRVESGTIRKNCVTIMLTIIVIVTTAIMMMTMVMVMVTMMITKGRRETRNKRKRK